MNQERLLRVILAPYTSEKASRLTEKNGVYVFEVLKDATKPEIKEAVEFLFKTKVATVNVLNTKPKVKRFGKVTGKRKSWKKAYVKLQEGLSLDFTGAA